MIFIFGIALASIYAQRGFNKGQEDRARRCDRIGLWIASVSYVVGNLVLLVSAAIRG